MRRGNVASSDSGTCCTVVSTPDKIVRMGAMKALASKNTSTAHHVCGSLVWSDLQETVGLRLGDRTRLDPSKIYRVLPCMGLQTWEVHLDSVVGPLRFKRTVDFISAVLQTVSP